MLYGIGLMLLLMSAAFVGGSALVPAVIAVLGLGLMTLGRRASNGSEKNAER